MFSYEDMLNCERIVNLQDHVGIFMPTDQYHYIRRRFVIAVAIVVLVLAGLICLHVARGRVLVLFSVEFAIAGLLVALFCMFSYLFLQQVRKIEQVNLKLEEQKLDLELKAELLDLASDAILLLDDKGQFIYFNSALQILSGYSREELLQRGLHGIKPPEYAARIQTSIETIMQQGEAFFESAYLCKSGSVLPVEVHAHVANVNGRPLILSMVRDVSERKETENKLIHSANKWQHTFDAVEDVIWLLDMNRTIVHANAATQKVFGKSMKDVVGLTCCEAAHDDLKPHQSCPFDQMMVSKKRASLQVQMASRWFEFSADPVFSADGSIIKAVHIAKDITTLKIAEHREQVRSGILERIAGREPLSQLLSFIAVSIEKEHPEMLCSILLVSDDGTRLLNGVAPSLPDFYNRATNRIKIGEDIGSCGTAAFRRERVIVEDIDNHPFWKDFTPAQEAGLRSCWSEPIISSSGVLLGTFAIYHRTPAIPAEDEISLIQQAAVFAGIAIERSKGEAERLELEHLLSQAQKMEAIGHLSGGIAHDFNNLLTPILIYSDMLKRSLPDNEKAQSKVDGIIKASGKARELTQQLLSFGRKQIMQMQVFDLNNVIMSFHSMVRRTLRENISISLQLASQPVVVRADGSKLEQVLLNLVLNAQDAIAVNGSIVIETGQVFIDDEFVRRHPGMTPGRFVLLSCTDNGCGMSAETMTRIFEPFFSTKEAGRGTGLGLANVYGIVKQHNGTIMAVSTVGVGTTFKVYLPFCDEQPQIIGGERAKVDLDHSGSAVILLVEDNEMVRVMSNELLEGLGYTVYCADHPERALEMLKEVTEKIDLVITDVVMPGMNGQQLFERITAHHPEIGKVLYMSGYTNNVIITGGELEDGLHFLQKPFTVDALMAKVKELLHGDGLLP
jgi:two-component system cell cycle sensor histidine kinase/response regulator CckA